MLKVHPRRLDYRDYEPDRVQVKIGACRQASAVMTPSRASTAIAFRFGRWVSRPWPFSPLVPTAPNLEPTKVLLAALQATAC